MPAHSSWQLIVATMQHTAASFRRDADDTLNRLEDDASGAVVNAARAAQMRMVMIAAGGFSMLEGILEQTRGWAAPFKELDQQLRAEGLTSTADDFMIYRLATNVLKHGYGESYEQLLRRDNVPFRVKARNEDYFEEGDVGEIPGLILVDDNFVHSCALVIEEALTALRIPRLDI
jgi:hypothetical protein